MELNPHVLRWVRMELNPHVLRWTKVKFSLSSILIHPNTCGLIQIRLQPKQGRNLLAWQQFLRLQRLTNHWAKTNCAILHQA
jgi:hypothetical protein